MAKKIPKTIRPKRKKPIKLQDWLCEVTGHDRKWWVARVQGLITKHSKPTKDPHHAETATANVITDLTRDLQRLWDGTGRFDGNMRTVAVLSIVLATWYLRVHRAKIYDPRRPVKLRRSAYYQRLSYAMAMFKAIEDESLDAEMFPGQNWEFPFSDHATDGYFI